LCILAIISITPPAAGRTSAVRVVLSRPTIKNYFRSDYQPTGPHRRRLAPVSFGMRHNGKGCGRHVTGRTRAV